MFADMSGNDQTPSVATDGALPVHLMNPAQRLAEALDRIVALHRHFSKLYANVKLEDRTLIIETEINNYFIDVSDEEPRFLTMQAVYVVEPGNYELASLACALATERSYGAKAIAHREGSGYRLHFVVQLLVLELSAFTGAVGVYQGMIEDCRETYLRLQRTLLDKLRSTAQKTAKNCCLRQ